MFKIYYILTYPITLLCLMLIWIYKKTLSKILGRCCAYMPTCSVYTYESIKEYGFLIGGFMGFKRLFRCNHHTKGGYDFVKLNLLGNYKWKC